MATTASTQIERPVPGPPGPLIRAIIRAYPEARRDLLGLLSRRVAEYGGLVCLRKNKTYLAVHPDYVKHILQDNHPNYIKGPEIRRILGTLIGEGLLTSDHELWRRQRSRSQPFFLRRDHPTYLANITPRVEELCRRWTQKAHANEIVNINEEMARLAVAANFSSICSDGTAEEIDAIVEAFLETGHSLNPASAFNPVRLPRFIPTPKRIRFRRAVEKADAVVYRLIADRRKDANPPQDLLSGLIFNREGESGGDELIRDEIMTMLHSGFETASDQIVWSLLSLTRHPEILARVRNEVDRVLGDRFLAMEDLSQLVELHRVQWEVMRLFPAAWGYFRTALKDDWIDGFRIPAGAVVLISAYLTHRMPQFWDSPTEFRPERFAAEEVAKRHKFAFFPFGAGPRHCIGGEVATLLIASTMSSLIRRFAIIPLPGQDIRAVPRISLKPEPALWVRLALRS